MFEPRVEVLPVEGAAKLVTLGEKWKGWGSAVPDYVKGLAFLFPEELPRFVRLRPPAGTPASEIEGLRRWLTERGCSVKLEKAVEADAVPRELEPRAERPHRRTREVVEELLAASRSDAREELAEFVRQKMDAAKM